MSNWATPSHRAGFSFSSRSAPRVIIPRIKSESDISKIGKQIKEKDETYEAKLYSSDDSVGLGTLSKTMYHPPKEQTSTRAVRDSIMLELGDAAVQYSIENTVPRVAADLLTLKQKQIRELEIQERLQKETTVELENLENRFRKVTLEHFAVLQKLGRAKASIAELNATIDDSKEEIDGLICQDQQLKSDTDIEKAKLDCEKGLANVRVEMMNSYKRKLDSEDKCLPGFEQLEAKQHKLQDLQEEKKKLAGERESLKKSTNIERVKHLKANVSNQGEDIQNLQSKIDALQGHQAKVYLDLDLAKKKNAAQLLRAKRRLKESEIGNQTLMGKVETLRENIAKQLSSPNTRADSA